jgi:hypothetical protein
MLDPAIHALRNIRIYSRCERETAARAHIIGIFKPWLTWERTCLEILA